MGNETSILCDEPAISPINRLPNEILIKIFKYLYDTKSRQTSNYSPFMLFWRHSTLVNCNSRCDHVLRELRLVCAHWNALVLDSLKLLRYFRLCFDISMAMSMFKVNFILLDETVTPEHARQISEALSFIPNILSFQFSCSKLHAANVVDIKKLFDCFTRPRTVWAVDFAVEQWTPELYDAIADFVTKHRSLIYIRLSFSEPGCFEQHKKLTYSTLQEWDKRSFVTINGKKLKNFISDDDFTPDHDSHWLNTWR